MNHPGTLESRMQANLHVRFGRGLSEKGHEPPRREPTSLTCWRRLRYWQRRGVWKKLLRALLQRVGQERGIDWEHCCVDSQSFRAVFGGP